MNIQLWIFIIKEERSEVHFKIPFLRSFSTSPPLIPGSERMYLGWANVSQIYNNLLYILMFAMVLNINHLPLTFECIHIFCTICAVFANFSPYILNFNYIDVYAGVLSVYLLENWCYYVTCNRRAIFSNTHVGKSCTTLTGFDVHMQLQILTCLCPLTTTSIVTSLIHGLRKTLISVLYQ